MTAPRQGSNWFVQKKRIWVYVSVGPNWGYKMHHRQARSLGEALLAAADEAAESERRIARAAALSRGGRGKA